MKRESHTVNSEAFEMVHCPPGTFTMGSPKNEANRCDDETQHKVTLTRGFAMGVVPVTQELWEAVVGSNNSLFEGRDDSPWRPAENVSWFGAVLFCNALSKRLKLSTAYTIGDGDEPAVTCDFTSNGFRLPTEAEWEYAARSGGDAFVYAGSDDLDEVWDWKKSLNSDYYTTQEVGQKKATRWGLHDLSGNVWEWCWDLYGNYTKRGTTDPTGASKGPERVMRGGSWANDDQRVALRREGDPNNFDESWGLRLSRTIVDKAAVKAAPAPAPPEPTPPPQSTRKPSSPTASAASAAALPRETHTVNSEAFEMVHCPPGTFTMGSPEDEADRSDGETQHEVTLTHGFALGVVPVTQALWEAVTGENPSAHQDGEDAPQRPVEGVSWFDGVRFCNALSVKLGLMAAYTIGEGDKPSVTCDFGATGFRLPTEAEWEYAARSGDDAFLYAGGDDVGEVGWYRDNSDSTTHEVGQKQATRWGLHDLSGNVGEWCWDPYNNYTKDKATNPTGAPTGLVCVYRGGSWMYTAGSARAAFRGRLFRGLRRNFLGLRLSRTIP